MQEPNKLMNISATFLWRDIPLIHFVVKDGFCIELTNLTTRETEKYLPITLWHDLSARGLHTEMESRIMPQTRQHLQETLAGMGIETYSWDAIVKVNHALNTDDCRWLRFDGETLEYKNVQIRRD